MPTDIQTQKLKQQLCYLLSRRTKLITPITSQGSALPCRVALNFQDTQGFILLDQLRAVDKQRLIKKLGSLDNHTQTAISNTLVAMFIL